MTVLYISQLKLCFFIIMTLYITTVAVSNVVIVYLSIVNLLQCGLIFLNCDYEVYHDCDCVVL